MPWPVWDTYSLPPPGADLVGLLESLAEYFPHLPLTGFIELPLPGVRESRLTREERDGLEVAAKVQDGLLPEQPQSQRGRPPLNSAEVARVASMMDIGGETVSWVAHYLYEFPAFTVVTHSAGSVRHRGVERARSKGRLVWAELGAWPWALNRDADPPGNLARTWWKEPRYSEALRDWVAGRLPL